MRSAVFICPGRGTYNRGELGYLSRHFPDKALLAGFDDLRQRNRQAPLSEMDGESSFSASLHTRGDNASGLIFAASYGDFLSVDTDKIEIVAVTGNSMGWYSALACAGALPPEAGFALTNTMGTLMHEQGTGGQIVYPFMRQDWRNDSARKRELLEIVTGINELPGHTLDLSIDLGGMLVIAGDEAGLTAFEKSVPRLEDRFPMRLPGHAAFHTALQEPVSMKARELIGEDLFGQPRLPMIDGRGAIWWPHAVDRHDLWDYTLGHQVTETYDFTRAIEIAAHEFAPDLFVIAGPGTTLGGSVIQSLILAGWKGIEGKSDFEKLQSDTSLVLAMGNADQRPYAIDGETK